MSETKPFEIEIPGKDILPYESVLETDHVYTGPTRSFPKKTFSDGSDNPEEINHELKEINNYLDYSVFSKNQLRFTEKLLKTSTYVENETYLRGPNFFISLDKPKYWNLNNYTILTNNIKLVCAIVNEMLDSIPGTYKTDTVTTAKNISTKINDYIAATGLAGKNFVNFIKGLINYNEIKATLGIQDKLESYLAIGLFCATYNKVISTLTYFNPWVQVKKDAGVNTMTPPVNTIGNVAAKGVTVNHTYVDLLANATKTDGEAEVKEKSDRELKGKKSETITDKRTGEYTKKSKTTNTYLRIYNFPLYSLNILFPIKLLPTAFITFTKFTDLATALRNAKLPGSILKIPISSILSKIVILDSSGRRVSLNVKAKKEKDNSISMKVTATSGQKFNLKYYRQVMGVRTQHYIEGSQTGTGTAFDAKLLVEEKAKDDVLNQAIEMSPQTVYNEPDNITLKTLNSNVVSTPSEYRRNRIKEYNKKSLRTDLGNTKVGYRVNANSGEEEFIVNGDEGTAWTPIQVLRQNSNKKIEFYSQEGNKVFEYNPEIYKFDL